ncbi:MAG: DUF6600 domain-containing protein [Terriglobia bacterium]
MKTLTWRRISVLLLSFLAAGLFASMVLADEGDPPGRVARLSIVQGKVSFQPSGETDWTEASVNRPVTTGDRLYTDPSARAELEVGPFAVHISEATDITLANLNDQLMQLGVGQGTVRVTVYKMPDNNSVEIDTPNGALVLETVGSYRVDTAADGSSTQVTVNAGTLQISAGDLSQTLQSGQAVKLTGTETVMSASISLPPPDDFDKWCAGRDRRVEESSSAQQVGPDVPGDEDLDTSGTWTEQPDLGPVWIPANVSPGWVPYRNGHWVFIEPWGWTWVEAEPWGYAPFHYGRWAQIGPVWAWVPGPVMAQPVFAPALVAFVGGPGLEVGMGMGLQAWFPLGPGEPFVPWYHYGPNYLAKVSIVPVMNITNIHYRNRAIGVTAVSGEVFRGGQPVAQGLVRVAPEQLARAQVAPHPGITPTDRAVFGGKTVAAPPIRAARLGAAVPASPEVASTPRVLSTQPRDVVRTGGPPNTEFPHVFARNAPASPNPPFAARQDAYASHPGRPLEPQQMDNLREGKPAGPMKDKELIPHPAKEHPETKTPPPHGNSGHH